MKSQNNEIVFLDIKEYLLKQKKRIILQVVRVTRRNKDVTKTRPVKEDFGKKGSGASTDGCVSTRYRFIVY
jgi:hypothetical protein